MKILFLTVSLAFTMLSTAATAEWKQVLDRDQVKVFAGDTSQSGIIPFKATANINASLKTILNVLLHNEKKPEWAPKLDKAIVHKKINDEKYIFSEYYSTPWPATDREFLLKGHIKVVNPNLVELKARSIDNTILKSKGHIQTDVKYMNLTLKQLDSNLTQMEFTFHGDMKGWMPVWLMNLIQKKWPLRFVQGLRKQVKKSDLAMAPAFEAVMNKL